MLDALAIPPRLILRALDDLHTLADSLRRLTDSEGDLDDLVEAVKVLPRTEDELSANIALLREDLGALSALLTPLVASLQPLPVELRDLDETAEALERSMGAAPGDAVQAAGDLAGARSSPAPRTAAAPRGRSPCRRSPGGSPRSR